MYVYGAFVLFFTDDCSPVYLANFLGLTLSAGHCNGKTSSGQLCTAVCSVQCAVCIVLCAVCIVQCAVCSVQCAVCSVQCAVCSVQCAVCRMYLIECRVQCSVCTWWLECSSTTLWGTCRSCPEPEKRRQFHQINHQLSDIEIWQINRPYQHVDEVGSNAEECSDQVDDQLELLVLLLVLVPGQNSLTVTGQTVNSWKFLLLALVQNVTVQYWMN